MTQPHIVILGAGPAGLGAAFQLSRRNLARVTLLERNDSVGGIAGSFKIEGIPVDYGSHRLHPSCDPEILGEIKALLGDDLLDRPRHGRINLRGRWIHFPLKPLDLALRLPLGFSLGTMSDLFSKVLGGGSNTHGENTFATVMEAGLGRTICRDFYFPYARKIWGLSPESISSIQAQRRVSASSLGKLLQKVLMAVPGLKPKGSGRFFYPKGGFGQISERLYQATGNSGADFRLGAEVLSVEGDDSAVQTVSYRQNGETFTSPADYVWSTIPVVDLAQYLKPQAPLAVREAAHKMEYRSMILIYLVLEQSRFSEYDAHYFPESNIPITRISEPKNYSVLDTPKDLTVLCAELPCFSTDAVWGMTDEALGEMVCQSLESAEIPVKAPVKSVLTRRLHQAYPVYRNGYESNLDRIDQWLGSIGNLLSFGRQGLFAHDNTHHALYMAHAAVDCLGRDGRFDHEKWRSYRAVFETHVVED